MDRLKVFSLSVLLICTSGFAEIEDGLISTQSFEKEQNLPMEGWIEDFSEAKKEAEKKNLPLLIAFLGPSWCEASDLLEKEILTKKEFVEGVKKEAILFKVDIPENFQDPFMGKELKEVYGVEQCPCIVITEANGSKIATLPFIAQKTSALLDSLRHVIRDFEVVKQAMPVSEMRAKDLKKLYTKAGHLANNALQQSILKQGLSADETPYFLLEEYGQMLGRGKYKKLKLFRLRNQIISKDPNNTQGYQRKLALLDFEALASLKRPRKADTVVKPLVRYLQKFGNKDVENAWEIEMRISQYFFGRDEMRKALNHAQASLQIAPSAKQEEITKSIKFLKTKLSMDSAKTPL